MFIDEAKIRVKAGDGGNGCVAFRREKYVPRGGPSGGDGGKGGDVYLESSERHNTLVHFRFNPEYKAERGRHGEGSNRAGREGEDIVADYASLGLTLAKLQTQTDPVHFADLASFQRVPGPPPTELFFATPWTVVSG